MIGQGDPAKDDEIWKGICGKELQEWGKSLTSTNFNASQDNGASYYRVPAAGDTVTVSGMRRRPELNGARGEIVSGGMDEFGRVTVLIPGAGGARKMKIQPFRLVPMKSASTPSLNMRGSPTQDDRSSVRSCSRPGSIVSGAGSRLLGSAVGTPAPSALSNAGRLRMDAPPVAPSSTGWLHSHGPTAKARHQNALGRSSSSSQLGA